MLLHSRPLISRRRVAEPRAASPSAAVSTHSQGPPYPRAARTLSPSRTSSHATLFIRSPFSPPRLTPVERSERVAGWWAVRARANPLSLGVWHFTVRFVLPGVGLATRAESRKAVVCSHPLDPKSTLCTMLECRFNKTTRHPKPLWLRLSGRRSSQG